MNFLIAFLLIGFTVASLVYYLLEKFTENQVIYTILDVDKNLTFDEAKKSYRSVLKMKGKHPILFFNLIVLTSIPFFIGKCFVGLYARIKRK